MELRVALAFGDWLTEYTFVSDQTEHLHVHKIYLKFQYADVVT